MAMQKTAEKKLGATNRGAPIITADPMTSADPWGGNNVFMGQQQETSFGMGLRELMSPGDDLKQTMARSRYSKNDISDYNSMLACEAWSKTGRLKYSNLIENESVMKISEDGLGRFEAVQWHSGVVMPPREPTPTSFSKFARAFSRKKDDQDENHKEDKKK